MTDEPALPTESDGSAAEMRSGFATIIGAPNAGKSTLLNHLVGAKVSIVTHKVQTTRTIVRGVWTGDDVQVVFVDTPGIFRPKRRLDRAMVRSAWSGVRDADVVIFLVDAVRGLVGEAADVLEELEKVRVPRLLALNKVDIAPRERLLEIAAAANGRVRFDDTYMVSATTGSGTADLMERIAALMPPHPFYYPDDQVSDLPLRLLAAEVTREKLYLRLHQELPYDAHVETEAWDETKKGIRIEQTIYVARETQRGIVLGKGGQAVKAIGSAARRELTEMLDTPVHLFIHVKVRNWESDPERYREMGLEFPS